MTVETKSLKFPMEWKAFVQVVVIIAMLIGASVAGVQVSMNVGIESRVEDIESRLDAPVNSSLSGLQKPYTEIVCMVDAYYVRQNGTDGRLILPYSTNKTYVQQQSLGNVTTGSVYLKEMTLASGLTYGSTVLVIQQYQGQLSYYSNSALIYTVKAGSLNVTTLYSVLLNSTSYYLSGQLLGFVQPYSFLVDYNASSGFYQSWYGANSTLAYRSTNASQVINNAVGNLSDVGGVIYLKPDVVMTGTLILNRGNVSIISDTIGYDFYYDKQPSPQIQKISINSSAGEIDKILLQGLTIQELLISPYNTAIQEITVRDCAIYKTDTWNGLVFSGSGYNLTAGHGWFNNIRFESCRFTDKGTNGVTRGLIHFTNGYDWTELSFTNCDFECDGNTNTFFFNDGTASVVVHIINPRFMIGGNGGTVKLFHDESSTGTIQAYMNIDVIGGKIESSTNYTVLSVPASTNAKRLQFRAIGVEIGSYSTGVTIFNCTNTNWASFRNFIIMQNCPFTGDATFSIGTLPTSSTTMKLVIQSNPYFNPQGFSTTTPTFPATNVDVTNTYGYTVRIYMLTIGTTTAYQITDPSGTALAITTALIAGMEITLDSGAKIRFTFSAAPTWKWYGT